MKINKFLNINSSPIYCETCNRLITDLNPRVGIMPGVFCCKEGVSNAGPKLY